MDQIANMLAYANTHPGLNGKDNEDRYGIFSIQVSDKNEEETLLAVVADGIGGHLAGEIAAEIVVKTISQSLHDHHDGKPVACLIQAFADANREILAHARDDPAKHGMGSTCVCVWVIENKLYLASVGDSRIYLIRKGIIRQLTRDHTWIQKAVETGKTTKELASSHIHAHVILRYLGSAQKGTPDFRLFLSEEEDFASAEANQGLKLQPGDKIYLCTDGLTDLVEPKEMLDISQRFELDQSVNALIDMANQRGGHDNITVLGVSVLADHQIDRK
jgi:serine/threonine protein phosphatase PrpC